MLGRGMGGREWWRRGLVEGDLMVVGLPCRELLLWWVWRWVWVCHCRLMCVRCVWRWLVEASLLVCLGIRWGFLQCTRVGVFCGKELGNLLEGLLCLNGGRRWPRSRNRCTTWCLVHPSAFQISSLVEFALAYLRLVALVGKC